MHTRGTHARRAASVVALAGALALGAAGTAQADFTTSVTGTTLTITGSTGSDVINIGAAGGVIAVNDQRTTLAANRGATIVANMGLGDDVVEAGTLPADAYLGLTANGGDGDDRLIGGAGADTLNGDTGADHLEGRGGFDSTNGGTGDDIVVWNAGDGIELSDAGDGADEMDVNGSDGTDAFTANPDQVIQGRVTLDGDGAGITTNAEHLEFDGNEGDDSFRPADGGRSVRQRLAQLVPVMLLDGGPGQDDLEGFDGADTFIGPEGHDTIVGGDGDDRVVGNGGLDFLDGRAGDDVFVWNTGDGTDFAVGGDGNDRLIANGSDAAADAFSFGRQAGDPTFEDRNPSPAQVVFGLNDPGPEALTVNGGGGDDSLTIAPGAKAPAVTADGGAGSDALTGGDEADTFLGGAGNDVLDPGLGADTVDGGDGDDRLLTRDGIADRVSGGNGTDSARTDATTIDTVDGVENLDTPTPAAPPPPSDDRPSTAGSSATSGTLGVVGARTGRATLPTVGSATVRRRHRRLVAGLAVACPASSDVNGVVGVCAAKITLKAAHGGRTLGSKLLTVAGGARTRVQILLARVTDRLVHRARLPVRVRATTVDGDSATISVRLRVPR